MSPADAVARSFKRSDDAALAPSVLFTLATLALAALLQAHFGAFGDVSWLITVCEGWLDGKLPYVDFFETNPPPAVLLYMPPVIAARLLHLRPEMAVAAYGIGIAWGSAMLSSAILKRAGLLPRRAPLFDALTLIALVLLPGRTFDERDFFALCFGLPYIVLCAVRAERSPVALLDALVAGAGLGLMVALKAPYAAIPALLALRLPLSATLRAPENLVALAVAGALTAISFIAFPAYFADVAPIVATAYLPVRESLATLLANAALVAALTLGGVAIAASARARPDNLTLTLLIAAAGAAIAYFVQGKGWLYHLYPALALASMAFATALERHERDQGALAIAGALAAFTFGGAALIDLAPLPTALVGAIGARLLMMRFSSDGGRERLTTIAGGALTGAACGLYALSFPGPSPAFIRALREAAPHPRIATMGEGLGIGFPLTRNVEGEWTMRVQGMLMTAGARRLIDEHPLDEALKARLAPIIERERDGVAKDIEREKPNVLLVSRHGPRFHAWAMSDPLLSSARAPYRFVMSNPDPQWPVDLYVRDDPPLHGD